MAQFHPDVNKAKIDTENKEAEAFRQAENDRKIAEENLKKRLAEEGIQRIEDLKDKQQKLNQDRAEFEKQKSAWLENWEKQKVEETDKIKKVKAYWESKATPIKEAENELATQTNQLVTREQSVKAREQSLETRIASLDSTIKLKEKQIDELQNIIVDKAPRYHQLFKHMLSEGESRRNWNYNIARGDQWHNFTERIRAVFEGLHHMLFGDN